jgi:hypothetical protein
MHVDQNKEIGWTYSLIRSFLLPFSLRFYPLLVFYISLLHYLLGCFFISLFSFVSLLSFFPSVFLSFFRISSFHASILRCVFISLFPTFLVLFFVVSCFFLIFFFQYLFSSYLLHLFDYFYLTFHSVPSLPTVCFYLPLLMSVIFGSTFSSANR